MSLTAFHKPAPRLAGDPTTVVELSGVSKSYDSASGGARALDGVSLTVRRGEFVSVVGRSGSGKSTLLRILALTDLDYVGSYRFVGSDCRGRPDGVLSAARRRIGYLRQDAHLLTRMTVAENLEVASWIRTGRVQHEELRTGLAIVGLGGVAGRYPQELSGGQRQRVALVRALMGAPDLLIADEPTASLDPYSAAEVLDALDDLRQECGTTVVVGTHDPAVQDRSNRRMTLDGGLVHNLLSV